jgi:hypothetical protein
MPLEVYREVSCVSPYDHSSKSILLFQQLTAPPKEDDKVAKLKSSGDAGWLKKALSAAILGKTKGVRDGG